MLVNTISTVPDTLDDPELIDSFEQHSSWQRATKVMHYVLKFTSRGTVKEIQPTGKAVFHAIIKLIQRKYNSMEIAHLKKRGLHSQVIVTLGS